MDSVLKLEDSEHYGVSCEVELGFSRGTSEVLLITLDNSFEYGGSTKQIGLDQEQVKQLRDHLTSLIKEMV